VTVAWLGWCELASFGSAVLVITGINRLAWHELANGAPKSTAIAGLLRRPAITVCRIVLVLHLIPSPSLSLSLSLSLCVCVCVAGVLSIHQRY